MIGSLVAMFLIGMGVMFCICGILFLKYIEPLYPPEDDSDFYPYDDADMQQMALWEEEYRGKHEN